MISVRPEANYGIRLYPNPSHGILNIKGLEQPVRSVTVFDVTGRAANATYSYIESENVLRIEFSSPNNGLVILKIETGTGVIYRKVMVY